MLNNYNGIYISLDKLKKLYKIDTHQKAVALVNKLVAEGKIQAIKNSELTPQYERIHSKYRIIREKKELTEEQLHELNYIINPKFDISYYRGRPEEYSKDREFILLLNKYFIGNKDNLSKNISVNERSFEIFQDEKFLADKHGESIIKNLGLDLINDFNVYRTPEPFIYLSVSRSSPQNVLIIENKDTFITISKLLLEGNYVVMGKKIGSIIYGEGKKIPNSIKGLPEDTTIGYMMNPDVEFLYWGDIDRTGFSIFNSLKESAADIGIEINLWCEPYKRMVEKNLNLGLPLKRTTKEQHCSYDSGLAYLEEIELREYIDGMLKKRCYLPQEILNKYDMI